MKVKVCGLRDPENVKELVELPIDYMGFIFYSPSPRYAKYLEVEDVDLIPESISKVGVFVNEIPSRMFSYIDKYKLNAVQLHGNEEPRTCKFIKSKYPDIEIIKAFSISDSSEFNDIIQYEGICNYFLFDTKSAAFGGSGNKFDWSVLDNYKGNTPFFLSGGISIDDVNEISILNHPMLYGVDINSKFETSPGMKDVELVSLFVNELKS